MKVRSGQIPAEVRSGKFGEEYRISRQTLINVGLLEETALHDAPDDGEMLVPVEVDATSDGSLRSALRDLFVRHENAMFRMGYLEAELERSKALAENAESLQEERRAREGEIEGLRRELEQARTRAAEIDDLRAMLTEMEQETERLRAQVERYREAEERRLRWYFWRR